MQKILLAVIGLSLLGFGGYRQLSGVGVSPDDQARCEQVVRDNNSSDAGMVAMMDAKASGDDAQAAARRISEANQGDLSAHLLDWAMMGAGLVMLGGVAIIGRRRN